MTRTCGSVVGVGDATVFVARLLFSMQKWSGLFTSEH